MRSLTRLLARLGLGELSEATLILLERHWSILADQPINIEVLTEVATESSVVEFAALGTGSDCRPIQNGQDKEQRKQILQL
jgi:hypothetical protein